MSRRLTLRLSGVCVERGYLGVAGENPSGAGDEIQLTDAIDMLIEKETVEAYHMKGKSHDCGNKLGYMQAFVEYGIRHNSLGAEFKAWLEEEMGIKK